MAPAIDDDRQFRDLLSEYHQNFGESATVSGESNAVRLSVLLSPEQFETFQQEIDNESPDTFPPETPDDSLP